MKRLLLAIIFVCVATAAQAADLPVKARVAAAFAAAPCTINQCSGFYGGADLSGIATNANVLMNGIAGSLNAGGTNLGVHAGYRTYNGKLYLGAEIGVAADVAGGTSGIGASFSDRWSTTELFKVGGSLSSLLGTQSITFPQALQPYLMSLYGIVGAKQRTGTSGIVGGAGAEFVIDPRSTLNLEYLNVSYGSGGTGDTPGITAQTENLFRLSYNYNF